MLARMPIRFMRDAAVGYAVFLAATVVVMGPSEFGGWFDIGAQAAGLTFMTTSSAGATPALLSMLAGVFCMLFALNIAFLRHLRQVAEAAGKCPHAPLSDVRTESH